MLSSSLISRTCWGLGCCEGFMLDTTGIGASAGSLASRSPFCDGMAALFELPRLTVGEFPNTAIDAVENFGLFDTCSAPTAGVSGVSALGSAGLLGLEVGTNGAACRFSFCGEAPPFDCCAAVAVAIAGAGSTVGSAELTAGTFKAAGAATPVLVSVDILDPGLSCRWSCGKKKKEMFIELHVFVSFLFLNAGGALRSRGHVTAVTFSTSRCRRRRRRRPTSWSVWRRPVCVRVSPSGRRWPAWRRSS